MDNVTKARLADLEKRIAALEVLAGAAVRQPPKPPQGPPRR